MSTSAGFTREIVRGLSDSRRPPRTPVPPRSVEVVFGLCQKRCELGVAWIEQQLSGIKIYRLGFVVEEDRRICLRQEIPKG